MLVAFVQGAIGCLRDFRPLSKCGGEKTGKSAELRTF
jgi:hypothetical protein